ncbi:RNase H domain-containing protein [Caerostris darwini]|uniref:RNase H domain-containing protein n=1 Tax=Caerostris darwini TaxID=1538125 RepID=A0AAV4RYB5_9ARAC|nr:RNase H domain-containing protein [Caerostris darwini]
MTDHHALTFSENLILRKIPDNKLWCIPPIHNSCFKTKSGADLAFKDNRAKQTAFSRFVSGHIQCLSLNNKACVKCELYSASPQHLLKCVNSTRETSEAIPLLFLEFLDGFTESWS